MCECALYALAHKKRHTPQNYDSNDDINGGNATHAESNNNNNNDQNNSH